MTRPRLGRMAVLAALIAAGPAAKAQQGQSTSTPEAGAPVMELAPRVGVQPASSAPMTLEQAIQLALEHNNDVAIARLQRDEAVEQVRFAVGVYDPRLLPLFNWQKTVSATTSSIGGGVNGQVEERRLEGDVRLEQRSPWGGGLFAVDFTATRVETSNQFQRLNPQFPSALGVSFTQPLLRNFRLDAERRELLLSRRAVDLSDAQLTRVLMDQLSLVEQAYWDLVFATRNLDVLVKALAQARGQVASNERQVRSGTLAPIDVVEAQTQVATFEQTVATAQQTLTEAENRLKRLVLRNREASLWNEALSPSDVNERPVPHLSLEEAMKLALAQRPELREIAATLAQNEIDTRFYADQARPQMDLVGSYALSGLAGTVVDAAGSPVRSSTDPAVLARLNELSLLAGFGEVVIPPSTGGSVPDFFVGGLGESLSNIWARRFPVAMVGVQMDIPLGNRAARANRARTQIARRAIERQREETELAIEVDVRNALQAVASSEQRLTSAGSARRSAQEQYESEQRRFESGLGTVFLVLQRQTTFVTAQAREVRARADLNQAVAIFDRAVGSTLTQHNVKLQASSAD
jgi:outer membrane protein TolC